MTTPSSSKFLTVAISFVFSISLVYGQQKLNMDFEYLSTEGVSRPWGWSVYSYASEVQFKCDTSTTFSGKYSLMVKGSEKKDKGKFELSYFIEPNQILNNKITLEGWVKSDSFIGSAGINLKSLGSVGDEYGVLKEGETQIKISKDWEKYSTEISIGPNPHSILATLFFEGSGTVWFDKLQIKINNQIVQKVPVAEVFTDNQLSEIEKETVAFSTVEASTKTALNIADFRDLDYFKHIVGASKIIALGESTHGTSEFFNVKHRLLQFAILELGVKVFILEDNQLIVEKINDYVLYGKGDAKTVIKGLFAVWNTVEMLELIKWIRSFNIANPNDMVEFVGMDVQNPQLAIEHLEAFLEQKDSTTQKQSSKRLSKIKQEWRNSYFKSDSILIKWDKDAAANHNLILSNKERWLTESLNKSDSLKVEWAVKNSRTIKQFVETALGGVYEGRDKAMAENVEWIINQRKPNTKVLIWAHDSHISRGDASDSSSNFFNGKSMGSYLSKRFKEEYSAFGLFTYQGTCLGTISYSDFTQSPFEIYTSPEGSLDEALHRISVKNNQQHLLLDLKTFKNDSVAFKWINKKRPVRYVGYVAEDYGFGGRYAIPYQFDGIIFIDKTKAANKIN